MSPRLMARTAFFFGLAGAAAWAQGGAEGATFSGHLVAWVGRFHPVVVHFPVALIITAALAELLWIVTRQDRFTDAARFIIVIAGIAAPVAVALGLAAEATTELSDQVLPVLEVHEALGITTAALAVASAVLSELGRRRQAAVLMSLYRAALFLAAALVTLTGFFGGELVYGIGHYSW